MVDVKLDFLPEERRKILMSYPFIVGFLSREDDESKFLDNLRQFESDESFQRAMAAAGVKQPYHSYFNLLKLVEKIRREAGFIVYCHAGGREDVTDFPPGIGRVDPADAHSFYTRGFYRIRIGPKSPNYWGARIEDASRMAFAGKSEICATNYHEDFDVVAYGTLPISRRVPHQKKILQKKAFFRGGIFGWEEEVVHETHKTIYGVSLNQLVETKSSSPAFYVRFTIRTTVLDTAGRKGAWPCLIIVCDQHLMTEIFDYIWENIKQYDDFINLLVDRANYPNINKGILDKREKLSEEVIFFHTDEMLGDNRKRYSYYKMLPWVIKEYGKIKKK